MVESENYEDADSYVREYSNNNIFSNYKGSQDIVNNLPNKRMSKGNESSVYQDAQSRVTNNSQQKNNFKNSFSNINQERNDIELKKEFLNQNNMIYNDENNIRLKENYDNEDNINNNGNNVNKSEYSEPEGGEIFKNKTLFEGSSQRGGCCNMPKCLIF